MLSNIIIKQTINEIINFELVETCIIKGILEINGLDQTCTYLLD